MTDLMVEVRPGSNVQGIHSELKLKLSLGRFGKLSKTERAPVSRTSTNEG